MKYFIDNDVWYQGKRQPPQKVVLEVVIPNQDGKSATCYDKDGDSYTLKLTEILEEE